MKKVIVIACVAVMLLTVIAGGASAWIIKVQAAAGSTVATITTDQDNVSSQPGKGSTPELRVGVYAGNNPSSVDADGNPTASLIGIKAGANAWYGKIFQYNGYDGSIDFRLWTVSATKAAPGDWYIYKGIIADPVKPGVQYLAKGTFAETSVYNKYTDGPVSLRTTGLAIGDQFTITNVSPVPEPSSIIAVLSGLVGLVGIRRRK